MSSISPSQLADHLECPRRRFLRSFHRVPEPPTKDPTKRDMGTALHSVAERWLNGATDPFPEGWDRGKERGRAWRLSPREAEVVRRAFWAAVEAGVLRKLPGREVEVAYSREVIPGVPIRGKIDQRNEEVIEDHKTTGQRKYALSSEDLAKDPKMLCYAAEQLFRAREKLEGERPDVAAGTDPIDSVKLRLNYFLKELDSGPPSWAVEADVPVAEVDRFWREVVVPSAREMVHWESLPEGRWREVEGPRVKGACTAYGGCPYQEVCSGRRTPGEMRLRTQRKEQRQAGETMTDAFDIARRRREAAKTQTQAQFPEIRRDATPTPALVPPEQRMGRWLAGGTPVAPPPAQAAPVAPPPAQAAPVAPPPAQAGPAAPPPAQAGPAAPPPAQAAPVAPTGDLPPWAVQGCQACGGTGIHPTKPLPCRACDVITARCGGTTSAQLRVWEEGGRLRWGPPSSGPIEPEAKVQEIVLGGPAPVVPAEPPAEAKPRKAKEPKEAKPKGFRLLVSAVPMRTPFVLLSDVLDREGKELAAASEVASFYELDAFRRRDAIASKATEIAASLEGQDVVHLGDSADLKALRDALLPLAREVIRATF